MTKLSPRDWEALSAYLDGQLKPKEQARLEHQLNEREALRDALEELKHTRLMLRSQPRLQAPRNFTLTPEMAGVLSREQRIPAAYPALRLASVLATIFFLVVFLGDLALNVFQPVPLMASQLPRQEAPPPGVFPPIGLGGGGDEEVAEEAPEMEQPAEAVTVEKEAEEPQTEVSKLGEAEPETTDTLRAQSLPVATPTLAATAATYQEGGYPAPPEEALQVVPPESYVQPVVPIAQAPVEDSGHLALRWIQALLALLAIATGIAALYLRRRSRS